MYSCFKHLVSGVLFLIDFSGHVAFSHWTIGFKRIFYILLMSLWTFSTPGPLYCTQLFSLTCPNPYLIKLSYHFQCGHHKPPAHTLSWTQGCWSIWIFRKKELVFFIDILGQPSSINAPCCAASKPLGEYLNLIFTKH